MIICPAIEKSSIRDHYDLITLFYRLYWGPHIHHGLWDQEQAPRAAQVRLMEQLAARAGIATGEKILDVGCGMGGSSIQLAAGHGCTVTGITLSRVQRYWATLAAAWSGVRSRTQFLCGDAELAEFAPGAFDVVWSIECTEHLFDKPRFFQRAARWLKPGGRVAICAWLAGDDRLSTSQVREVEEVCEGFLCPSLGSAADYERWLRAAGLEMKTCEDWTARVIRTWEICRDRVAWSKARWLAPLVGRETTLFLERFETILNAYRSGAMKYGCFVATLPNDSPLPRP